MNTIGRYEVVERIGSGGFATVYRVRDPVLDSEVAAKVLADNWSDKGELHERFIREAQLLRRIDSDRVVTVHDIGELPTGQPYFVMALVERGTLDDRLLSNPQPSTSDMRMVATQLAECVRVVHEHGLIHRDIKPSNLLIAGPKAAPVPETGILDKAERLVLGDFGLAKDVAFQATSGGGLTISAGTGGYAAPEQMSHEGIPTNRTDLYASTAMMFRVVTGTTPPGFDLATQSIPFPENDPAMAEPFGSFFRRGMAFDQQHRHGSVDEWLDAVLAVIDSLAGTGPLSGTETIVSPAPNWNPPSQQVPPGGSYQAPNSGGSYPAPNSGGSYQAPNSGGSYSAPAATPYTPQPAAPASAQFPVPPPRTPPSDFDPNRFQPAPFQGASAAAHSAPVLGQQADYANQGYSSPDSSVSYQQVTAKRKSRAPLIVAALLIVALAAVGGFFAFRPTGPTIIGDTESVIAGEPTNFNATYEEATEFEWTNSIGEKSVGTRGFTVTGILPGTTSFSVRAIDPNDGSLSASTTHTITILESPDAPEIIGPGVAPLGETTMYEYSANQDVSNPEWVDQTGMSIESERFALTPEAAGKYTFSLIVTLEDGVTRVGTTKVIDLG